MAEDNYFEENDDEDGDSSQFERVETTDDQLETQMNSLFFGENVEDFVQPEAMQSPAETMKMTPRTKRRSRLQRNQEDNFKSYNLKRLSQDLSLLYIKRFKFTQLFPSDPVEVPRNQLYEMEFYVKNNSGYKWIPDRLFIKELYGDELTKMTQAIPDGDTLCFK